MQDGQGQKLITWNSDLETGIKLVDDDHKVLVSLLNQVSDSIADHEERATLGSVLNSLAEYTHYHFSREERLLEAAGYSDLAGHRALHRKLAAEVEAICLHYAESPETVRAQDVRSFLRTWLVEHIQSSDMDYCAAVRAAPQAIAAAQAMVFGEHSANEEVADKPKPVVWADMRVLVVEDNRNFQIILKTILTTVGVRNLTIVGNGQDGLTHIQDHPVDLVLCDWRMEPMDGMTFIKSVRDLGMQARIILMTGYGDAGLAEKAKNAGANSFLEKPITARGFLETAVQALA